MEFPWRCNVDTIAMDLKVSWEMLVNGSDQFAEIIRGVKYVNGERQDRAAA